jgi:Zn-dependent protease with chaperone function
VPRARFVFALQAALGAIAAAVVGLALIVSLTGVSFAAPSARALAQACQNFALPHVTAVSLAGLALGSCAVAVLWLAARSATRQLRASRQLLARLHVHGDGPDGAVVFDDPVPRAFCAGVLRPRVYVSSGALHSLTPEELDAVLAHEAHHARLCDPLRVLIARTLSDALFFLPAVRRLGERYSALAELAADEAAVRARGTQPLASALLAFEQADPAVVGIAPERVDQLLGDRPAWELPLALIAWALVALTALAVVALRLESAMGGTTINLPLAAARLCMLAMAVVPLVLGAGALLGVGRLARGRS